MKKNINFINLIEVVLFIVILLVLVSININEKIEINFSFIYWTVIFIFNFCYYTFDLIKNKNTPKISVYSPTALFAYVFSLFGTSFVKIKNRSYMEFIKSANDSKNMTKNQRLKSYLYYWLIWGALLLIVLFAYLDDKGVTQLSGIILLFIFLLLIYRVFMLYDFANKKEGK